MRPLMVVITQKSLDSVPCQRERDYAHALNKRILPVLLEDVDIRLLPTALQILQFVDYRQRSTETALKLARALHLLPPAENLPDPLPPQPHSAVKGVGEPIPTPKSFTGVGFSFLHHRLKSAASMANSAEAALLQGSNWASLRGCRKRPTSPPSPLSIWRGGVGIWRIEAPL